MILSTSPTALGGGQQIAIKRGAAQQMLMFS